MPFIPPEQLARAREMDLLTYLRCCEPEELVSAGGNTYATRSHDSLKISNGKWYWWSRGVGGSNALDYLTTVRELPLPEAVQRVLSAAGAPLAEISRKKTYPTKAFSLPPDTPTTGVFFHTCMAAALILRSSTIASGTACSMNRRSITTAYSLALLATDRPTPCSGERCQKSGLWARWPAAINDILLLCPQCRAAVRRCVFSRAPLTPCPT